MKCEVSKTLLNSHIASILHENRYVHVCVVFAHLVQHTFPRKSRAMVYCLCYEDIVTTLISAITTHFK